MDKPQRRYVIAIFDNENAYRTRSAAPTEFVRYTPKKSPTGEVSIEYVTVVTISKATTADTWKGLVLMGKVCKAVNEDIQRDAAMYFIEPTYAAVIPRPPAHRKA